MAVAGRRVPNVMLRAKNVFSELPFQEYSAARVGLVAFEWPARSTDWDASRRWVKGRAFVAEQRSRHESTGPMALAEIESGLAGLDGRFSLCEHLPDGRLLFATDLLGAGSIYHTWAAGQLLVSTHLGPLIQLLPKDPELDRFGSIVVLAGGASLEGSTPYQGISRLRGGRYLLVDPRGGAEPTEGSYGRIEDLLSSADPPDRLEEAAEELDELMVQSIRRESLPHDVALMLSSGRDSQAVAQALRLADGPRPIAYTYGTAGAVDLRLGRSAARRLDVPHKCITLDRWEYRLAVREIVALHGGMVGLQAGSLIAPYTAVGARHSVALTGFLGDALSGGHLPPRDTPGIETVSRLLFPRLFRNDLPLRAYFPDEVAALEGEVRRISHMMRGMDPHHRSIILDLTIRQATTISLVFDVAEWQVDLAMPMFHRRLLQFFLRLPPEMLRRQELYDLWRARCLEDGQRRFAAPWHKSMTRASLMERGAHFVKRSPGLGKVTQTLSRAGWLPAETFDWRAITRRSRGWLQHEADRIEKVSPLRALCRDSASSAGGSMSVPIPSVALALPICVSSCGATDGS